jgi:hypothetical protein
MKFEPVAPLKLETLLQLSDALCGSAQQTAQAHVVPQHWLGSKATKRYGKSMGNPESMGNPRQSMVSVVILACLLTSKHLGKLVMKCLRHSGTAMIAMAEPTLRISMLM